MKARPRSVENQVAEAMNAHFSCLGLTPIERIPVLGRTGPDLTINELKLVVDVKSRREVPQTIFFPLESPFLLNRGLAFPILCGVRLENLDALWSSEIDSAHIPYLDYSSKLVSDYLAHMEEWTKEKCPAGISCVILHRPKMPIGASVAFIHFNNRRRLIEYAERYRFDNPRE